jgi:hypothetical protein
MRGQNRLNTVSRWLCNCRMVIGSAGRLSLMQQRGHCNYSPLSGSHTCVRIVTVTYSKAKEQQVRKVDEHLTDHDPISSYINVYIF